MLNRIRCFTHLCHARWDISGSQNSCAAASACARWVAAGLITTASAVWQTVASANHPNDGPDQIFRRMKSASTTDLFCGVRKGA
jgi:hypothetical protein